MSDNNMKFNLFIGENFNELISLPTNQLIIRNLLSVTDRDVIVLNNNLSLPEFVQKLMDKVLYGKKEIVEIINNIFSMESKIDLTFYRNIFDSNIFSTIISTNYDYTLEENFLNLIKISTPFNVSHDESGRIGFYKIFGDYKDRDTFIISTQDIKRVKMLAFYNEFWDKLRAEFNKRPTLLFVVNFEDKVFLDVLDFIIAKTDRLQPIYLYASDEIERILADKNIINFINKYSIEIIKGENEEFLDNIKEKFYGEKRSGDVQQNYAWLVRMKKILTSLT